MRNIQKVIATGISLAMATTMCVALPATNAFAAETGTTAESTELIDINEAIKSSFNVENQFYMGEPVTPLRSIRYKDSALTPQRALNEGTDYTVEYTNNNAIGKATATITGIGEFTGTKTYEFNIVEFSIDVTYQNEAGDTKKIGTLDYEQVKKLLAEADDNKVDLYYQHGTEEIYVYYIPAGQYLTYDSIMRALGVTGWKHVTGIAEGFTSTPVSKEVNEQGMFFPAQSATSHTAEGATPVPAIISLANAKAQVTTTAGQTKKAAKAAALSKEVKLFCGATVEAFTSSDAKTYEDSVTGRRLASNINHFAIDSYTPLKANTIKVSASKKTVKNNAKQTVKLTVKNAKGAVTYSVKSAPSKKAVKVSKKGVVTIAKGAKAGKYVISVKAAGTKAFKAATKNVSIKVVK